MSEIKDISFGMALGVSMFLIGLGLIHVGIPIAVIGAAICYAESKR